MIIPCKYDDIIQLIEPAKQDKVALPNHPSLSWWAAYQNNEIVGCAAIMKINSRRYRLRGCFILPNYRGQGLGTKLIETRISFAKTTTAKIIDVFTYWPSAFIKQGWTLKKQRKTYAILEKLLDESESSP